MIAFKNSNSTGIASHSNMLNFLDDTYCVISASSRLKDNLHIVTPISKESHKPHIPWEFEEVPVIAILKNGKTLFQEAITNSKKIIELPYNWDDEGAKPVSLFNWTSTKSFLENYFSFISENTFKNLPIPNIDPVPDGSIDVSWINSKSRMLININGNIAKYYGDLYQDKNSIKGEVDTQEVQEFLAFWLSKFIAE